MPHVILGLVTLPIQVKSTKYEYCHIKNHLATNELLLHILHIWHIIFYFPVLRLHMKFAYL